MNVFTANEGRIGGVEVQRPMCITPEF